MRDNNYMKLEFASRSENEAFARVVVASFASQLDPDMNELTDIKTVVSEAVTNAIIHGYDGSPDCMVTITAKIDDDMLFLSIQDNGIGIADPEEARQPLFTSKPELERSGMGFTIMENFMDKVEIETEVGRGTTVRMAKRIESKKALYN
ncbi:MAG: anti-sigma F factor [Gorillibacterium sp.]|nr:anti-sigma F factor [Gorillibacterium sp.]